MFVHQVHWSQHTWLPIANISSLQSTQLPNLASAWCLVVTSCIREKRTPRKIFDRFDFHGNSWLLEKCLKFTPNIPISHSPSFSFSIEFSFSLVLFLSRSLSLSFSFSLVLFLSHSLSLSFTFSLSLSPSFSISLSLALALSSLCISLSHSLSNTLIPAKVLIFYV